MALNSTPEPLAQILPPYLTHLAASGHPSAGPPAGLAIGTAEGPHHNM